MFVDLYAIQNVPSSNINRDDTGSPKTALYGGSLRARVSSQAWKRAMRLSFKNLLPKEKLGVRTKLAVSLIADIITEKRPDLGDQAETMGIAVLNAIGVKTKASKRKGETEGAQETDYLVFIAKRELSELADVAISWVDAGKDLSKVDKDMKKQAADVFHGVQAVDIALFGRMLADAPALNTDASCQVAHALSVDRVTQEYDYFTAVDDCVSEDNAGAGMIGSVEFNSSTLYRYATVDLDNLLLQLGDAQATAEGLTAFVEAFVRSMPTGKQNTFANRTLPSTVVVAFRRSQPVNVVSAFEDPVRPIECSSISEQAENRLAKEMKRFDDAYGVKPEKAWLVSTNDDPKFENSVERVTLSTLLESVKDEALEVLSEEE